MPGSDGPICQLGVVRLCIAAVDTLESFNQVRIEVFPDLLLIGTQLAAFDPWTFESLDELPSIDDEQIAAYWVIGERQFTLLAARTPTAFIRASERWKGLLDGPIAATGPLMDDLAEDWDLVKAADGVWTPRVWSATAWRSEAGALVVDVSPG